jgi:hypothetical protein
LPICTFRTGGRFLNLSPFPNGKIILDSFLSKTNIQEQIIALMLSFFKKKLPSIFQGEGNGFVIPGGKIGGNEHFHGFQALTTIGFGLCMAPHDNLGTWTKSAPRFTVVLPP